MNQSNPLSPKIEYLAKRSFAAIIDYLLISFFIGALTLLFPYLFPDASESVLIVMTIASFLLFVFLWLTKDVIKGISLGKWTTGLMVRDAVYPENVPNWGLLLARNFISGIIHIVEFVKIIIDKDNQRFGDKIFVTTVIDNPDKAEFKYRILTAGFVLSYYLFSEFCFV